MIVKEFSLLKGMSVSGVGYAIRRGDIKAKMVKGCYVIDLTFSRTYQKGGNKPYFADTGFIRDKKCVVCGGIILPFHKHWAAKRQYCSKKCRGIALKTYRCAFCKKPRVEGSLPFCRECNSVYITLGRKFGYKFLTKNKDILLSYVLIKRMEKEIQK